MQTDNTVITGKEAENDEEGKSGKTKDAIGCSFEKKKSARNDNSELVSEYQNSEASNSELATLRVELTVRRELQLELALLVLDSKRRGSSSYAKRAAQTRRCLAVGAARWLWRVAGLVLQKTRRRHPSRKVQRLGY